MKMYSIYSNHVMHWFFNEDRAILKSKEWGVHYEVVNRSNNTVMVHSDNPHVWYDYHGAVMLGDRHTNAMLGDTVRFYCHENNIRAGLLEYQAYILKQREKSDSYYSQPWV